MFRDGLRSVFEITVCAGNVYVHYSVSRARKGYQAASVVVHASARQKSEFITNTRTNGVYTREFTTRNCRVKLELYRISKTLRYLLCAESCLSGRAYIG